MKKGLFIILLLMGLAAPGTAENYLLNGGQQSHIEYRMTQRVQPAKNTRKLVLSYVIPKSFSSPTYQQKIENLTIRFEPPPTKQNKKIDKRGNQVLEATWSPPVASITATIAFSALNDVSLSTIRTSAPFPLEKTYRQSKDYLRASKYVPSDNSKIRAKAQALTNGATTEFDAAQRILSWVIDHMHYVLVPSSYDGGYSFKTGRGNCQNYSHLAAALLRAVDIPVRIVNGITLKEPYDVKIKNRILTMKMAQGRHSWIEIFFPDLGWVPFDPAGTELFVSNRFIRLEIGVDNHETGQDGLMRWLHISGIKAQPKYEEQIQAQFPVDKIQLAANRTNYGPRNLLLSPVVDSAFEKMAPPPPSPVIVPPKKLSALRYHKPYVSGNLDFPVGFDFLTTHLPAQQQKDGSTSMRKNFIVETAEYITTKGQQYAQLFEIKKPVKIDRVGLALHKFNDDGQIWIELYRDDNGKPGAYIATSNLKNLKNIAYAPGYNWIDFDFRATNTILGPGRYWIALGFTGGPIVNWFYSYGKPVGPPEGTRYKKLFDETWSRSLSFEFNYRVLGLTTN
jgi:hypothetical protein